MKYLLFLFLLTACSEHVQCEVSNGIRTFVGTPLLNCTKETPSDPVRIACVNDYKDCLEKGKCSKKDCRQAYIKCIKK